MQANSCASVSSKIAVPVYLPTKNPCRTSWRRTISLRRVLMITSTTFHRSSKIPIRLVSVSPLGIRTMIFHPISLGISTSFCQRYNLGGKRWTSPQPESPPLDIYLNALRKGVCDLLNCEVGEVAPLPLPPPPSKGFSLLTLNGLTWVGTGLPGGGVGYFRQYIMT